MIHQLVLKERKILEIEGVEDLYSFDENEIYLKTAEGNLSIEGENLHMEVLSLEEGKISLEGKVDGLYYSVETPKKTGLFGKKMKDVRR